MSKPVELTIDDVKVVVPSGTLLVEASKRAGIEIPIFCHHDKLKPVGACRMCIVEIEKMPRLQTACTTPVAPGMVVRTATPAVKEAREGVLEFLLANHPLDCPICDKGGECPLQDNTFAHGQGHSRLSEPKRVADKALPLSERIVLDRERCILCYRCTRFHDEIAGDGALVALDRGGESEIGTLEGARYDSPFSGNTVEICPVGALTSRHYRFRTRPWELARTDSVCNGCSVGCNVRIDSRDGSVLRVASRCNDAIDDGWLCDHGRYDTLPPPVGAEHAPATPGAPRRARFPALRTGGALQRVPFAQAATRALELLAGGNAAIVLSPRLTNEALQLAARELRTALPGVAIGFSEQVDSPWPVTGRIAHLATAKKLVDLGCDPWYELPILALRLRKATAARAPLVVVGPGNGLFRDTAHWLKVAPDAMAAACEDLLAALLGKPCSAAAAAAAQSLRVEGPAAVLLGTRFAHDPRVLRAAQQIAAALGAEPETGFLGAPCRASNARGACQLAPGIAGTDPLAGRPRVVFSFGLDAPVIPPGGVAIVATSAVVTDHPAIDVVFPLAHAYETDGHVTNLEGTVQPLRGVELRRGEIRPDHHLLQQLLHTLRVSAKGAW
ncbi:MAG TPA: 2Fe-2S iron-sulfur cluster-binding protein [Planctomycetota bacterium]